MVWTLKNIQDAMDAADERRAERGHNGLTESDLRLINALRNLDLSKIGEAPFTRRLREKKRDG